MPVHTQAASAPPHRIENSDPLAIALLTEDHRIFRTLFDSVETAGDGVLFPIVGEICIRLAIHMNLEEQLFYPSLGPLVEPDDIEEAILEHQAAKRLIADILDMNRRAWAVRARVRALGDEVIRHIDEEDRLLLRVVGTAREASGIDLEEIGVRMQSRRRELLNLVRSAVEERRGLGGDLAADAVVRLPRSAWTVNADASAGSAFPAFAEGRSGA